MTWILSAPVITAMRTLRNTELVSAPSMSLTLSPKAREWSVPSLNDDPLRKNEPGDMKILRQ
jgi:hypothetical protein